MSSLFGPSPVSRSEQPTFWLQIPLWARWGGALLFNTLIALFLTGLDFGSSFPVNWVFSQCIGLTINASVELALRLAPARWRAAGLSLAVVTGSALGTFVALLATGVYQVGDQAIQVFWQALIIGLVFGAGMTLFAFYRERNLRSEQALDAARLKQLTAEKARVEAELRMLQAQIEPHFLFNTLAILRGLIGRDPHAGTLLLDRLIDYLRASLSHSRAEQAALGDELDLLDNYLTIMQFRMGPRLGFSITAAPELRSYPLPPMLLQPLVENAIRHGLEPKTGPCRLRVEAFETPAGLLLQVSDNGVGFSAQGTGGTGLANVRARLEALYRGAATLCVQDNEHGGVTASLRLPRT